ncbi:hypothetical protein BLNAU_23503 [Blattamonas nauphoetae]|uniref:Uncharacterized protein n=1 Tax=Blattamonas nauphoetae TaxID=2049346 RepID=A0ABQ9WU74_9EUKA|nr:hypothetical protein BLNAU_23503 [Blattamonas nauphoetae]
MPSSPHPTTSESHPARSNHVHRRKRRSVSVVVAGGELVILLRSSCRALRNRMEVLSSSTYRRSEKAMGSGCSFRGHKLASLSGNEGEMGRTFNSLSLRLDADKLWVPLEPSFFHFCWTEREDEMGCGNTEATLCGTVEWSVKGRLAVLLISSLFPGGHLLSIILSDTDVMIAPSLPFCVHF